MTETTEAAPEAPPAPALPTPQEAVAHNLQVLFRSYCAKRPNFEDRYEQEFKDVLVAVWTAMGWKS